MNNPLKFFDPKGRTQLEEFFSNQKSNPHVQYFLSTINDSDLLELKKLIEHGLQLIPQELEPSFKDYDLSAYFYLLSELKNLKPTVRDFLLDTMLLCEDDEKQTAEYTKFNPHEVYQSKVAPLLATGEQIKKKVEDHSNIAQELLKMVEKDQAMRKAYSEKRGEWDESIDEANTKRLKEIIEEVSWPTISAVGQEASRAAWLIVQHTPDRTFQAECLKLMKSLPEGEVDKKNIAYLDDRVRIASGKSQLYGTQFRVLENGDVEPLPIEDPEGLDERRSAVGLGSFEEYKKSFKQPQ